LPTSPISPPTEIGISLGSRDRMNFVRRAEISEFCRCCSASVGCERSTSVEVSMSIWKNPAGMASSIRASIAATSFSALSFIFFGLVW